jgi:hypothetical protein
MKRRLQRHKTGCLDKRTKCNTGRHFAVSEPEKFEQFFPTVFTETARFTVAKPVAQSTHNNNCRHCRTFITLSLPAARVVNRCQYRQ